MPRDLIVDDLVKIRHKYDIPSHVGMMSVPYHLYDVDDIPVGWWVIHLAHFKIRLWYLFPQMVARAFNTFDINFAPTDGNHSYVV